MSVNHVKLSSLEKKRFEEVELILINWYRTNRRKFSWRKGIRDPYEVLICEVMGQQTQASRIEEFLPRFLERFPSVKDLALAPQSEVIKAWQGLGYNRRALNLHRTAKEINAKYQNTFPKTEAELLALPGIGKYTAGAVLIFAFNKHIATVDINIQRLLSRLYRKMPDINSMLPAKDVSSIAENILPKSNSRLWHEALMDFGATICTKRNPKCSGCPLYEQCKSGKTLTNKINKVNVLRTTTTEPRYFGYPKRIWRGRVLKLISANETIRESLIIKLLVHSENASEFSQFIKRILSELLSEGFCKSEKKGVYSLA